MVASNVGVVSIRAGAVAAPAAFAVVIAGITATVNAFTMLAVLAVVFDINDYL